MTEPWVVRAAVADDEGCIVSMWIRSLWQREHPKMREPSPEFWGRHQPIVTALVRSADVLVACDPERASYDAGAWVIFGWAVTSGTDLVLGCGVKNTIKGAGYGRELARRLLGGRLDRAQEFVMRLPDLDELKLVPDTWARRVGWLDELLTLGDRVARRDALWNGVAHYVVDPARKPWVPGSQRAA